MGRGLDGGLNSGNGNDAVAGRKMGGLGIDTTSPTAAAGQIGESRGAPPDVAAFEEKEKPDSRPGEHDHVGASARTEPRPHNAPVSTTTSPKSPTIVQRAPASPGLPRGPRSPRARGARGKGREEVGSDGIGRLDA